MPQTGTKSTTWRSNFRRLSYFSRSFLRFACKLISRYPKPLCTLVISNSHDKTCRTKTTDNDFINNIYTWVYYDARLSRWWNLHTVSILASRVNDRCSEKIKCVKFVWFYAVLGYRQKSWFWYLMGHAFEVMVKRFDTCRTILELQNVLVF